MSRVTVILADRMLEFEADNFTRDITTGALELFTWPAGARSVKAVFPPGVWLGAFRSDALTLIHRGEGLTDA